VPDPFDYRVIKAGIILHTRKRYHWYKFWNSFLCEKSTGNAFRQIILKPTKTKHMQKTKNEENKNTLNHLKISL
jgi:hypothetical protein